MKKILFYTAIVVIWELVYRLNVDVLGIWKSYSFPSPTSVASSFINLIKDNTLLGAILYSLRRLIIGYAASILIGLGLGFMIYRFKFVGEAVRPLILGLQSLPSICWVPFALLWFGLGEASIIFIVAMGSTFAVALSLADAVTNVTPIYVKAAKTMGVGKKDLFYKIMIPAGLPSIFSGLKQGWAFAWRALISGEMIASREGLGYTLMVGRDFQDIGQVAAVMISIIIIGLLLDKVLFKRAESELRIKWGLE